MTNKKPKPEFPLCLKYGIKTGTSYYEAEHPNDDDVEQALSKAEAGTPHKLNSLSYNKGYEAGKKGARLEGMRIQHELEKDKRKVLEGNLEACLDINRQYEEEVKTAKQQGKLDQTKVVWKAYFEFLKNEGYANEGFVDWLKSQLEKKKKEGKKR